MAFANLRTPLPITYIPFPMVYSLYLLFKHKIHYLNYIYLFSFFTIVLFLYIYSGSNYLLLIFYWSVLYITFRVSPPGNLDRSIQSILILIILFSIFQYFSFFESVNNFFKSVFVINELDNLDIFNIRGANAWFVEPTHLARYSIFLLSLYLISGSPISHVYFLSILLLFVSKSLFIVVFIFILLFHGRKLSFANILGISFIFLLFSIYSYYGENRFGIILHSIFDGDFNIRSIGGRRALQFYDIIKYSISSSNYLGLFSVNDALANIYEMNSVYHEFDVIYPTSHFLIFLLQFGMIPSIIILSFLLYLLKTCKFKSICIYWIIIFVFSSPPSMIYHWIIFALLPRSK